MSFRVTEESNGSFEAQGPMSGLEVLARDGRTQGNIVAWRVNRYLRPLAWEVSEEMLATCSMERLISSLAADCSSDAVAMERT